MDEIYDMLDDILEEIERKEMTISDVVDYVKRKKGVEYSYKRVWAILRKKKKSQIEKIVYSEPKKARKLRTIY